MKFRPIRFWGINYERYGQRIELGTPVGTFEFNGLKEVTYERLVSFYIPELSIERKRVVVNMKGEENINQSYFSIADFILGGKVKKLYEFEGEKAIVTPSAIGDIKVVKMLHSKYHRFLPFFKKNEAVYLATFEQDGEEVSCLVPCRNDDYTRAVNTIVTLAKYKAGMWRNSDTSYKDLL